MGVGDRLEEGGSGRGKSNRMCVGWKGEGARLWAWGACMEVFFKNEKGGMEMMDGWMDVYGRVWRTLAPVWSREEGRKRIFGYRKRGSREEGCVD